MIRHARRWCAPAVLLLAGCLCGCDDNGYARFVPSEERARHALDLAMHDWQAGKAPSRIDSESPAVEVVDGHRRASQRLASYTILGETPGDGPRCFAVRLV